MDRKAIIIDLDGTLFNSRKEISDYNLNKVNECIEKGHCVIIATARPLRTLKELLPKALKVRYLVLCNGAWIVEKGTVIYRNELKSDMIKSICKSLISIGYKPAIEADDAFYTDADKDPGFEGIWHSLDEYADINACKVLAYKSSGIREIEIRSFMNSELTYVITDNNTLLQISKRDCTKVTACDKILKIENIEWKNAFAFGDDNNDLPVFDKAGFPIAMKNATDSLKLKAKWITETNDNNGVGLAIDQFILSKTTALSS